MSTWTDHQWESNDEHEVICLGCGWRKVDVEDYQIVTPNPWLCSDSPAHKAERTYRAVLQNECNAANARLERLDAEREDIVILRDHLQQNLDDLKELPS